MKVSLVTLTAEVPHPKDPSLVVTLRKLKRTELQEINVTFRQYLSTKPIPNGNGGYLMKKLADGSEEPYTKEVFNVPFDVALEQAGKFIVSVRGLETDNGPLAWGTAESNRSILDIFVNSEELDVMVPNQDPATKEAAPEIAQPFLDWIYGRATKPETFGITSGKTSPAPSIAS